MMKVIVAAVLSAIMAQGLDKDLKEGDSLRCHLQPGRNRSISVPGRRQSTESLSIHHPEDSHQDTSLSQSVPHESMLAHFSIRPAAHDDHGHGHGQGQHHQDQSHGGTMPHMPSTQPSSGDFQLLVHPRQR